MRLHILLRLPQPVFNSEFNHKWSQKSRRAKGPLTEEEAEAEEETMKLNVSAGETIGENVKGFGKRGE